MKTRTTHVIVLGAGYAGLLATIRLAGKTRRRPVKITLVNTADTFIERLRLHQFAANQTIQARPLADMLAGTGVTFVHGTATALDPAQRQVVVHVGDETQQFGYDYLLYALGSTIDRESVPGVKEHAYTFTPSGPLSAAALRKVLPGLMPDSRVLICGGGATGVEAAAEFAESFPHLRVQLVTRGAFGQFLGKEIAAYMRRSLERLGVTIQDQTTITEVQAGSVRTAGGAQIPYDLCVWTGGFAVPRLARQAGLAVNERGQVLVDPHLRSVSHPEIFAVGDAAFPVADPGVRVRMAAYTAVVMGAHSADCLSAVIKGKTPTPFSFAYAGQGIALGRRDAIGFNTYPNDTPNRPYFTGRTGVAVREFFVNLLAALPGLERRWPGFFYWMGKGRYTAMTRRALRHVRAQQST